MDICFVKSNNQANIRVQSIHGMLWLQTHFETSDWDAIASQQVILNISNAEMLATDAAKAGLTIHSVPSTAISSKY